MLTAEEVKNQLTTEDIIKLLCEEFGSPEPNESQGNLIFSTCVCHDGDSMKLWYYPESKNFVCYTHCGTMDLFSLVQHNKHYDNFQDAFKFVVNYFKLDINYGFEEKNNLIDDWDILQLAEDYEKYSVKEEEKDIPINENILEYFDDSCSPIEWQRDGISPSVMKHYGIRVDPALQKIIIPHRNEKGELIGIRGRTYDPRELIKKQKYMPVLIENTWYNHRLGKNLYGLYENQNTIKRTKKVLICESEKAVLQCSSIYGIDNCWTVATCGSVISQEQVDMLLKLGVEEVILGYDREFTTGRGETETIEYEQKLYKEVQPFLPFVNTYVIMDYDHLTKYKDSPTDCGKEILEKLMHSKIFLPSIQSKNISKNIKRKK